MPALRILSESCVARAGATKVLQLMYVGYHESHCVILLNL